MSGSRFARAASRSRTVAGGDWPAGWAARIDGRLLGSETWLSAVNHAKHAARGVLTREELDELVEEGMSIAEIAEVLDRSKSAVRYWLAKYGLRTKGTGARAGVREARAAGLSTAILRCARHGDTAQYLDQRGYYRCKRCRSEAVVRRRRKVKQLLVSEAGGRCALCGYDRCFGVLEFHHLDPAAKSFGLSVRGLTPSLAIMRAEAQKCVLLCSNCHAEVEGGAASLPA